MIESMKIIERKMNAFILRFSLYLFSRTFLNQHMIAQEENIIYERVL